MRAIFIPPVVAGQPLAKPHQIPRTSSRLETKSCFGTCSISCFEYLSPVCRVSWTLLSIYHLSLGLRASRCAGHVSISGIPHLPDQSALLHGASEWDAALNGQSPNELAMDFLSDTSGSIKTDINRPTSHRRTLQ